MAGNQGNGNRPKRGAPTRPRPGTPVISKQWYNSLIIDELLLSKSLLLPAPNLCTTEASSKYYKTLQIEYNRMIAFINFFTQPFIVQPTAALHSTTSSSTHS